MKIYTKKADATAQASATVTLPFELRQRSRLRVTLDNGDDVGIQLSRSESLAPHDKLLCFPADESSETSEPSVIEVLPAAESVSVVRCDDRHQFARACYHLGNRHVQLQIDDARLAYLHDHVLDEMLTGLGFNVTCESATFEPEAGAYGGGHHHGHDHNHDHKAQGELHGRDATHA